MPTIADLPIGAKIKFGAYSVNGEAPHKICWIKAHRDNTLLSEFLEEQCAFDAAEPNNPDNTCQKRGNCRYSLSNINQFLNAHGTNWYRKTHEHDEAPEDDKMYHGVYGYYNKPGFLSYFDESEIESIEPTATSTALPTRDTQTTGAVADIIYDSVFIPSKINLFAGDTDGVEDEQWDLFSNYKIEKNCAFSKELFENTNHENKPGRLQSRWYYSLRSSGKNSGMVDYVDIGGETYSTYPNLEYLGIRPALKLKYNTLVSDIVDEDGYYEVITESQEAIEISDDDFFAILKAK